MDFLVEVNLPTYYPTAGYSSFSNLVLHLEPPHQMLSNINGARLNRGRDISQDREPEVSYEGTYLGTMKQLAWGNAWGWAMRRCDFFWLIKKNL